MKHTLGKVKIELHNTGNESISLSTCNSIKEAIKKLKALDKEFKR